MQVFAAFNLGRPNYFLKPTGEIAEQVRTREWIVARIVDISEGVVDADDPASNPYGLAAGSKYFMLEAEPYTARSSSSSAGARTKSPQGAAAAGKTARPAELANRRASSASELPSKTVAAAATQTEEIATDEREAEPEESFSVISDSVAISPTRPAGSRTVSTPISKSASLPISVASPPRLSNLSAARPANLEPVPEVLTPVPRPPLDLPVEPANTLLPIPSAVPSFGASPPAFLPVDSPSALHRRAVSSATARPLSTSMPRSLGSSNGSGSSTLHKRMSSSFLGKPGSMTKGSPTTATTAYQQTQYVTSRSYGSSPQTRQTQTIGRYTGRKDRRQASASVASGSSATSAADLLRSFTVDM